jgi:cysteine desulfurase
VNAPDIPSLIASVSALENVDADIELVHREIIDAIRTALPEGFTSLGDSINRLPHILTITAPDIDGEALAHELDKRGYAVGSASACAVESATASHVLTSIGIPGNNNIRLSLPIHINNRDAFDTDAFVAALAQSADSLRRYR